MILLISLTWFVIGIFAAIIFTVFVLALFRAAARDTGHNYTEDPTEMDFWEKNSKVIHGKKNYQGR